MTRILPFKPLSFGAAFCKTPPIGHTHCPSARKPNTLLNTTPPLPFLPLHHRWFPARSHGPPTTVRQIYRTRKVEHVYVRSCDHHSSTRYRTRIDGFELFACATGRAEASGNSKTAVARRKFAHQKKNTYTHTKRSPAWTIPRSGTISVGTHTHTHTHSYSTEHPLPTTLLPGVETLMMLCFALIVHKTPGVIKEFTLETHMCVAAAAASHFHPPRSRWPPGVASYLNLMVRKERNQQPKRNGQISTENDNETKKQNG